MQIMVREHNMLHRQALILRAATFPLNDKDRQRLKVSLFTTCRSLHAHTAVLLSRSLFIVQAYLTMSIVRTKATDGDKLKDVHAASQVTAVLVCDIG